MKWPEEPLSAGEQPRRLNKQVMFILSLLSLKDDDKGQKHLIGGVHVGSKQQFMHLAGSSVALRAKLTGPRQTTGRPCSDTPGVHILSCFILQFCFKICSSVKLSAVISMAGCLCAEMQGVFDFS